MMSGTCISNVELLYVRTLVNTIRGMFRASVELLSKGWKSIKCLSKALFLI